MLLMAHQEEEAAAAKISNNGVERGGSNIWMETTEQGKTGSSNLKHDETNSGGNQRWKTSEPQNWKILVLGRMTVFLTWHLAFCPWCLLCICWGVGRAGGNRKANTLSLKTDLDLGRQDSLSIPPSPTWADFSWEGGMWW